MNWIDLVIIGIVFFTTLLCTFRGFFASFVNMFGSLISMAVAFFISRPFANIFIKHTTWDNSLFDKISSWLSGISSKFDINMADMGKGELSKHIESTLSTKGFPKVFQWLFKATTDISASDVAGKTEITLGQVVAQTLTIVTFLITSFVILFILIRVCMWLLKKLVKNTSEKHKTVGVIDRSFGVVFGVAKGFLIVMVIFAVLSLFKNVSFLKGVYKTIDSSLIGDTLFGWADTIIKKYFNFKTFANTITKVV